MRRFGWVSLGVVVALAACGPPEIHDLGDDDDAATSPPGTTAPTPTPTLTNVPSFATWNSTIRPLMCPQCHSGSQGGLTFTTATDPASLKSYWFESICDQNQVAIPDAGTQAFSPPTGRFVEFMRGNDVFPHPTIPDNAATVDAWYAQGGTTTPPLCADTYDLAGSS